ncbi:putative spermidine/putrescine transport system ATP-binding protein [Stella humosa]|uniref:Spermidine/putrescine import ATP-binding protein PotA n=1 Tax=Stella humosa TaxID=94 RepID=A0A3N1KXF3_9PROT|nr:ABC transporter ATP-binding protein [Stella humosa]ROP83907.1 putative spermidine/putrescine transport system ATP-binding protein [Stella humosa]BBK32831.1 polyamine-transporting ATPase [Stella humosa]
MALASTTGERASRSGDLSVTGIHKRYGQVRALSDVSLTVAAGEFLTILGPSGSGKTTLLKVVAGFETPDEGDVRVGGRDVTDLDPAQRNIGMVFQNYALFPHLTVERNVAFPLEMRRVAKAELRTRVAEALALVELTGFEHRLPRQLSGGQQQRVALARAIVFRPTLLLLDEPFGALDRKLREAMQLEVRRLQQRLGLTTLFITHDQEEALVMSDRIAVMDNGRLEQVGAPRDIYEAPQSPLVADFVGESNILSGTVETAGATPAIRLEGGPVVQVNGDGATVSPGSRVRILLRPERLGEGGDNRIEGTVVEAIYLGLSDKYRIRAAGGVELLARIAASRDARRYQAGDAIAVGFHAADARIIEVR